MNLVTGFCLISFSITMTKMKKKKNQAEVVMLEKNMKLKLIGWCMMAIKKKL